MIAFIKHFLSAKKQNQLAGIVRYSDRLIIESYHKTDTGVFVRSSEISVLDSPVSNEEMGASVLKHLDLSKPGISYLKYDAKKSAADYKKNTGLKSIKAQMNGSKYISVDRINGKLIITPHTNCGNNGDQKGYKEKIDFKRTLDVSDSHDLGEMIREAWKDCD